jgi:hypothetical protein
MVDAPPQRGVKTRVASLPSSVLRSGLSVLTPRLGGGALECRAGAAAAGWSSINSQLTNSTMDNNQPSFAERIRALKAAAETVMAEAQRMEAAARKFSTRRTRRSAQEADR